MKAAMVRRRGARFALAALLAAALAACGGGGGDGPGSGGTGMPSGFAPEEETAQAESATQLQAGEFRVNRSTAGDQGRAAVARLQDGGFVVTWVSSTAPGAAPVMLQRFDAAGRAVGPETQVTDRGSSPAITALAGGGFLVTWSLSPYVYEAHGYAQRFDAQGAAVGEPIQTAATFFKYVARPMGLPDGGFVLAVDTTTGRYGADHGQVVRYSADGTPVGQPVALTSTMAEQTTIYSPNWAGYTTTAAWPDGRFAAAWVAVGGNVSEVRLTRFDAQGNATGTTTRMRGTGLQHPALAVLEDGRLALAWTSGRQDQPKTLHLELFGADGASLGRRVVAADLPGFTVLPRLAALQDGGFALAWKSVEYAETTISYAVHIQRFDADGQAAGGIEEVSSVESPLPPSGMETDSLDVMRTLGSHFLVLHGNWSQAQGWDVHGTER